MSDVVSAAIPQGWDVALVTQTVRHDQGDSIKAMFDGVRASDKALGADRQFRAWRDSGPFAGQVCRIECTTGPNGAHVHLHKLMFFRRRLTDDELCDFEDIFFQRWAHCVERKLGARHVPSEFHGTDITWGKCVCGSLVRDCSCDAPEVVAGWYLSKMGLELSDLFKKSATGPNRSIWQVAFELAEAKPIPLGESSPDLELWESWCRATAGKRQVTWSGARGGRFDVRGELGMRDLEPDEEERDDPEDVIAIFNEVWVACQRRRRGFHLAVLHAAESDGAEAVKVLIGKILGETAEA